MSTTAVECVLIIHSFLSIVCNFTNLHTYTLFV